jgi:uncharacterized membrane protein YvlD (DUF360 family)
MARLIYTTLRNALLFFFFVTAINGIKIAGSSNLLSSVVAGLIFGAFIAGIPTVLKFFKLPVTYASTFLLALIFSFIFFFLLYSGVGGFGSVTRSEINLGIGTAPIVLSAIQTLVVSTVVTSLSVVGFQILSRRK